MLSAQVHDSSSLGLSMLTHVAGSQVFSGEPSSLTASPISLEQKKKPAYKRKRSTDAPSDTESSSSHPPTRTRDGPKKKKANRACFHCQKAHLTCDDSRPCQRCIKRGIADNCTEGHRKKAKYLLDEEELEALKRQKSGDGSTNTAEAPNEQPAATSTETGAFAQSEPMFSNYETAAPAFAFPPSDAANLEYSILSSILGNSPESGNSAGSPVAAQQQIGQVSTSYVAQPSSANMGSGSWPAAPNSYSEQQPAASAAAAAPNGYVAPQYQLPAPANGTTPVQGQELQYPEYTTNQGRQSQPASLGSYTGQAAQVSVNQVAPSAVQLAQRQPAVTPTRSSSTTLIDRSVSAGTASWAGPTPSDVGHHDVVSVYKSVTDPYDYTEGYHFLMKHLPTRSFEKNDILRVVRALAIFRPSLIALQMPMTEEDEIFIEKCFQRSLVELDKLVSFSGTPTLAWRRTGEICLVGPEFCMLTGWEKEELIGRKKYVYELFENQSVVEYWENFANHAFENTTQSVYSHCILLKPSGAPVPCTFCFSIRRDIMDLPSLVIGQWLPLL
ncbi:uncharacterized protein PHACADRAFT_258404 [Phanerochaete carnosa HHB-10118-sp]|uniref:Transcription activator of gluconeogenesis ERT1 n=1 Tax=Phanerochaete carnosa (strain HHB-10118-sp) TaxID=650164 RepID=K5UWS6_PHACS|nr:uncharacterized protein PHACADRAFT_258404 [Phanerochaete carnosa HHB-10118-sp]EKM54511.1 hypothetical protein PHACADRAFT_258404 [Phanerochaete carnosa HHB-10118-sp]